MTDQVFGAKAQPLRPARRLWPAMMRGFLGKCPNCGHGALFATWLKPVYECCHCGEAIHHQRADDFPPYLVMVIVGHLVVAGFLCTETLFELSLWEHLAIWVPITILLALVLLQPVKGAVIGMQWALYMHGFSGRDDARDTIPDA
ncbi:DUF983 domain-containing protein [Mesorhizobium abyssinicae]|uniref:DUF983 domain-containing protein n=1 Tax=Mesorhizobium abyssinicae TaxID=1209958 RepID=UPI0033908240